MSRGPRVQRERSALGCSAPRSGRQEAGVPEPRRPLGGCSPSRSRLAPADAGALSELAGEGALVGERTFHHAPFADGSGSPGEQVPPNQPLPPNPHPPAAQPGEGGAGGPHPGEGSPARTPAGPGSAPGGAGRPGPWVAPRGDLAPRRAQATEQPGSGLVGAKVAPGRAPGAAGQLSQRVPPPSAKEGRHAGPWARLPPVVCGSESTSPMSVKFSNGPFLA